MLEPIMQVLGSQKVVLASSSPRRQEILKNVGLQFVVVPSLYEEDLDPKLFQNPEEFVVETAVNKVLEVKERMTVEKKQFDVIIGADTMVWLNNKFYGKPKTESEAFEVLKTLSGKWHHVLSGVCIVKGVEMVKFCEKTEVKFGDLPEEVITGYVNSGEPMDKAGGYGIQGKGATLIEQVKGDYFNVVGLPLHSLCKHLLKLYTFVK